MKMTNINFMDLKRLQKEKLESNQAIIEVNKDTTEQEVNNNIPITSPMIDSRIAKCDDDRLGPRIVRRYEKGNVPHLHKEFYFNIKKELKGEKEGVVRTTEIARNMGDVGTCTVVRILYALEKFGYIIRDKKFPTIKGTRIALTDKEMR
jgi:hypothetical protein